MNRPAFLLVTAAFAASCAFVTHGAYACSCSPPQPRVLAPMHATNAPTTSHVRVVLPTYLKGQLILRQHQGPDVATKRFDSPMTSISHVELVPEKPLSANTRYEIALVRSEQHPSTLVFGTFATGQTTDTVAPSAPKITNTAVNGHRWSTMTSCAVSTPWIEMTLQPAKDPERDDAQVLYGVWASNAKGVVDLNAPPTAFVEQDKGKLKLGRLSYCDFDEFPLPTQGSLTLAVAALDESGNRSAVQRVTVKMSKPPEAQP